MDSIELEQELALERRARLLAERRLEHKQAELQAANRQLSDHALALSGQIVDQRKVVSNLKGENIQYSADLRVANTRVKAVEQLLWAALETIPDGFAMFGPDFRLIAANGPYLQTFAETAGVTPGDSYQSILDVCLDNGLIDLQGEDEDTWYDTMLDRWDSTSIKPVTLKFWNGMHVKMIDRRTADGGVVSLALNITDTITREAELREARNTAQAADRAKSAFLAKMSHELRTPMNGVVGMADLLLDKELDEEAQLFTETIRNSGHALLDIINDILDFSKIEANRLDLKATSFDLAAVARDVLTLLEPSLRDGQVRLMLEYDPALPTALIGDSGRMRQILINLVGNAVKFTETGYVFLRINGGAGRKGDSCSIEFAVEDSGQGIPEGMRDHIFGEFNQIEDDTSRQHEGTGLGLAITRKLVESMGGTLWVDSKVGQGSCFGFTLVLPSEPQDAPPPPPPALGSASPALVWIENPYDRSNIERVLRSLGMDVWTASTASEFDLALRHNATRVVICRQSRSETVAPLLASDHQGVHLITLADTLDGPADIPRPYTRDALTAALLALPDAAPAAPLHVLAAEDNKTNQLVLTKMLAGLNIDLHMVEDGLQAVEQYKQQKPDLVLLDISMPKMDGMEVARTIRSLENGAAPVPIVAMTAHAMEGDEARIKASGIDHYMTKPLRKATLRQHVESVAAAHAIPAEIAR